MPTQDVPRELMPFALALNDLLARVRELLVRERHLDATAAHQLRTPLAGLQLGLARAAECPDLASTRAALGELEVATQRTARMVQQLLALSRLDPDVRGAMDLEDVDLVKLARDVGEAYMDAAQGRHVELELDSPEHPVVIRGQRDLLTEALGNLIDNAVRYTPAGGRVAIGVAAAPATLTVADSGPGIGAEESARVFQPFVRGRGTSGEGSGLGLAFVKEIASLHHADLDLGRATDLGGTRFTLRFPAAPGGATTDARMAA
jgi:two-component system sensor histidine kinase TctE